VAKKKKKKAARRKSTRRKSAGAKKGAYTVHLIATAAGELLGGLAVVATTQFPEAEFDIISHPLQNTMEKLETTLNELSGERPLVLHALADEDAKLLVRNTCVVRKIPHFDATGPLVGFFSDCVGQLPKNDVSRLHQLDSAYQRRIDAMEFTLEHDDGLGLESLREADVVIVGVSRVSKTPTALYLGSRGYKVANVSIAPETGIPTQLSRISKKKVVAFTTQPKRLQEVRAQRAKNMGVDETSYSDLSSIIRELMAAEKEFRRRGYPILDITNLTIEQTAAQILEKLKSRPKRAVSK